MATTYLGRLKSFCSWPWWNAATPHQMAEAGFSYSKGDRTVECGSCGLKVTVWNTFQIPLIRHTKKNPDCPFLCDVGIGDNVRETAAAHDLFEKMQCKDNRVRSFRGLWSHRYVDSVLAFAEVGLFLADAETIRCAFCKTTIEGGRVDNPKVAHYKSSPECPFVKEWFQTKSECLFPKPKHPRLRDKGQRLATFKGVWPLSKPTPDELARCGFFYEGPEDIVRCFHCRKMISDWQEDDDPWTFHKLYADDCYFINETKRVEIPSLKARDSEQGRRDANSELSPNISSSSSGEHTDEKNGPCVITHADNIPGTVSD